LTPMSLIFLCYRLKEGHEQCLVLDGLWKPPPMPGTSILSFLVYIFIYFKYLRLLLEL
jgi:hypothetical protein